MASFQLEFYKNIARFYNYLGVAPNQAIVKRRKILSWLSVFTILVLYWLATIYVIFKKKDNGDIMTTVSNYIQSLLNSVAFSVVMISRVYHHQDYFSMLSLFDTIDGQLVKLGHQMNYKRTAGKVYIILFALCVVFVLKIAFEVYALLIRYLLFTTEYFILQSLPVVICFICMSEAILLVRCIYFRCRLVNQFLTKGSAAIGTRNNCFNRPTIINWTMATQETSAMEIEDKVKAAHQIIEDVHQLCERFNGYFGASLLAILTAMFAFTSIQSFYCYTIWKDMDEKKMRSLWTFFVSLNMVVVNLVFVSVLSYFSDSVTAETIRTGTNIRKIRQSLANTKCDNCIHFVLGNIKISAFSFFNINCTFLGGFFSALVTYILIMVQCNEIAGDRGLWHMPVSGSKCQVCCNNVRTVS